MLLDEGAQRREAALSHLKIQSPSFMPEDASSAVRLVDVFKLRIKRASSSVCLSIHC